MKILKLFAILALITAGFSSSTTPAYSMSSGWINANELQSFHRNTLRKNNIPTSMKCKNNNAVIGMNRKNTMVNVQYRPNTSKTKWRWAWGTIVGPSHRKLTKKGYKRVSQSSFRRPSGLLIKCAVWHKKR